MSKVCHLCDKRPVSGNNVSHSKRRTKRLFHPNLVVKRFNGVRRKICTACLRTLSKPPRVRKTAKTEVEAKPEIKEPVKKTAAPKKSAVTSSSAKK